MDISTAAKAAKAASIQLAASGTDLKNKALQAMAAEMWAQREKIFEANEKDLAFSRESKLAQPLLKRRS